MFGQTGVIDLDILEEMNINDKNKGGI